MKNSDTLGHQKKLSDLDESVTFKAPWEARLFALTVALNEKGTLEWGEWTNALSKELHDRSASPDASDYYNRWADAFVSLLVSKSITSITDIEELSQSWHRAAKATPHGVILALENDPQRR